jgi:hypothetical protein
MPAATETLGRLTPSMLARKSCVRGKLSESTLSWVIRIHLAQRSSTGWSRLQAADCETRMNMETM